MGPKERGTPMVVIGVLMMALLTPLTVVGGAVVVFLDQADSVHALGDDGTFHALTGESVTVYAEIDPASAPQPEAVTCQVLEGDSQVFRGTGRGEVYRHGGRAYLAAGSFHASDEADYRLACGGRPVAVDRHNAYLTHLFESTALGAVVGVLVAAVVGIAGLVLTVAGTGRRRRSRLAIAAYDRHIHVREFPGARRPTPVGPQHRPTSTRRTIPSGRHLGSRVGLSGSLSPDRTRVLPRRRVQRREVLQWRRPWRHRSLACQTGSLGDGSPRCCTASPARNRPNG